MRRNWSVFMAFALGILPPAIAESIPEVGEETSPGPAELVNQLGDERFSSREMATEKLIEIGLPAMDALETGLKSADREIRYRSERILYAVRRQDFHRRLEAFASGKGDEDLPGWQRFQEIVGDHAEARSLFVEMQRVESETIAAVSRDPKIASETLNSRTQQLQQIVRARKTQLTLGNVTGMIFLATHDDLVVSTQASSAIYSFCYQMSFQTAMQSGAKKPLLKKLLGAWISRGEDWTAYQGLSLAMRYEIPEGLETAERILKNQNNQPHVIQYALLTITKLGDESKVPFIERFLNDETRTSTRRINNVTYETQVRDIALACAIHLSKQDPKKFGYERLQMHSQVVFSTSTLGFKDDEERQVAFTKWQEFRDGKDKDERAE